MARWKESFDFAGVLAAVASAFVLCSAGADRLSAQTGDITGDGARPLAEVITKLEARYGWAITYEDPVYQHSSELVDTLRGTPAAPTLAPRGGFFYLTFEPPAAADGIPDPSAFLQRVVYDYNTSGNPGQFSVVETDGMLHVLPVVGKNAEGQAVMQRSILTTQISLSADERTATGFFKEVLETIEDESGVHVRLGSYPINYLVRLPVRIEASEEPALYVLARALAQSPRKLSWRLIYRPTSQSYMLNVHIVE